MRNRKVDVSMAGLLVFCSMNEEDEESGTDHVVLHEKLGRCLGRISSIFLRKSSGHRFVFLMKNSSVSRPIRNLQCFVLQHGFRRRPPGRTIASVLVLQ